MKPTAIHLEQQQNSSTIDNPASDGRYSRLLDSLLNGLTISLIKAPWWIAMLALVFSGPLSDYVGHATVYLIAGAVISMTVVCFFSSWKGAIWIPQDVPTAILLTISAKIIAEIPPYITAEAQFATLIVAIAGTSILTGMAMFAVGCLQLGRLVCLIPFPVIAGFLGGTGYLLLVGGIQSSLAGQASMSAFDAESVNYWAPCVGLALLMYGLGFWIKNALLIPILMLLAILVFFSASLLLGVSLEDLKAGGWLFSSIPKPTASALLSSQHIDQIQWLTIRSQTDHIIMLVIGSVIAMLLNNGGFELTIKGQFNHNKDLRVTGIANILGGMVGGWPGYISPAWSALNARQGHQLPLTGLIVALSAGLLLWYAGPFLSICPRFVMASAIAYVGVSFLFKWVLFPPKRLSLMEYTILLGVAVLVALSGL